MKVTYTDRTITYKDGDGIYYSGCGKISARRTGKQVIKASSGFGSLDMALECYEIWKGLGYKGSPASPASFWNARMRKTRRWKCPRAVDDMFLPYARGGWIECRQKGHISPRHYYYDINNAFLWSGLHELPVLFTPYTPGDKEYTVVMRISSTRRDPPKHLAVDRTAIVTNDDVEYYGLKGRILHGVSWVRTSTLHDDIWALCKELPPPAFKKLSQSYWGGWLSRTGITCTVVKNGERVKRWTLPPITRNVPLATTIVNRVTRRVHGPMQNKGVLCYIDSVMIPYELATGENPGDWKLERTLDRGIYVLAAGKWHDLPSARVTEIARWHKHAGYRLAIPTGPPTPNI